MTKLFAITPKNFCTQGQDKKTVWVNSITVDHSKQA
jgi:hypothetical protein